jgi:hypothetical protein
MIPRRGRTIPALIVAAISAAGGITVAIDVISVLAGGKPPIWPQRQIATQLRTNHWNDIPVLTVAAVIAFVGLLLLLAALTRGKRRVVPLEAGDPQVIAGTTRRSLRNAVSDAALQVDGIDHAKVKLSTRKAKIKAHSGLRDVTGLHDRITNTAYTRLAGIAPQKSIKVKTRVAYKEED